MRRQQLSKKPAEDFIVMGQNCVTWLHIREIKKVGISLGTGNMATPNQAELCQQGLSRKPVLKKQITVSNSGILFS